MVQKDTNRPRRVAELIKRELALIIPRELNDPRARTITLTAAEVARDLSFARIYFTMPGDASQARDTSAALNRAAGFLRHELKDRLALRMVPALKFVYDESVERGARISSLIDRALSQDKGK